MSAQQHIHPGDRLTFGCPACIHNAREAEWENADWRHVTWVFITDIPGVGRRQIDCPNIRRVPDHAGPWDVDERYIDQTGVMLSVRLIEQFPNLTDDDIAKACVESECVDVKLGDPAPTVTLSLLDPCLF